MTPRLATNYAKNYCNRTLIVKVIVENVVTCFLGGHGVVFGLLTSENYIILDVECSHYATVIIKVLQQLSFWRHDARVFFTILLLLLLMYQYAVIWCDKLTFCIYN